jgi:hypothetical protein
MQMIKSKVKKIFPYKNKKLNKRIDKKKKEKGLEIKIKKINPDKKIQIISSKNKKMIKILIHSLKFK